MCEQKVRDFFNSLEKHPDSLLVAVSGGSDSVALLHICMKLSEELNIKKTGVAHVNYGMRGKDSENEERFVRELASGYGCAQHFMSVADMDLSQAGVEERARRQRYGFFKNVCDKHGYIYTATGHTRDDCAESVMLNLIRGTGINGLEGIKRIREDGIVRPLLSLSRSELRRWLKKNSCEWKEDSTNNDTKYMRNWVRHELFPLIRTKNKDIDSNLVKLSKTSRVLKRDIRLLTENWKKEYHVKGSESLFIIKKGGIEKDDFVGREVVCALFREYCIPLSMKHVCRVIEKKSGGKVELLPDGWKFIKHRDYTLFFRGEGICPFSKSFNYTLGVPGLLNCKESMCRIETSVKQKDSEKIMFDKKNLTVFCDFKKTGRELVYRSARKGDRFRNLGSSFEARLHDVLKNAGVPGQFRENFGVVANGEGSVLWVPGVAVSQEFSIDQDTEEILQLFCSSEIV